MERLDLTANYSPPDPPPPSWPASSASAAPPAARAYRKLAAQGILRRIPGHGYYLVPSLTRTPKIKISPAPTANGRKDPAQWNT